ncbi:hypothetical protein [Streptomyces sp. IBSBF 3136]|uniref:hypothetical protein n=1 Tax=Streptomyces sp. IBSBF 3136 TaxID=2903524 RepID=UPI002FDC1126
MGISTVDDTGRGGFFTTTATPQIRLNPITNALSAAGPPTVNGQPGDLLVAIRQRESVQTAELWFCNRVNSWTQIA